MSEIQVGQINSTDGSTAITVSTGNTTLSGSLSMGANNISFSNGNGIDFSASEGSGATSSVLDDYEVGTWTPSFGGATFSGATANGHYVKIGDIVHATYYTGSVTISGASGSATISGLPFSASSSSNEFWLFNYQHGNAVDGNSRGGYIGNGNNVFSFIDEGGTAGSSYIDGGGKFIMVTVAYRTA